MDKINALETLRIIKSKAYAQRTPEEILFSKFANALCDIGIIVINESKCNITAEKALDEIRAILQEVRK